MGRLVRTVVAVISVTTFAAMFSACGESSLAAPSSTPTPHTTTVPSTRTSSIAVTGTVPAAGQTSQLTATATLSNGTMQDVTTQATWSSSSTDAATVTSGGLLKVLTLTSCAVITATYQGMSGQLSLGPPGGAGCWDY